MKGILNKKSDMTGIAIVLILVIFTIWCIQLFMHEVKECEQTCGADQSKLISQGRYDTACYCKRNGEWKIQLD